MDVERERLAAQYKGYTDEQLFSLSRDERNLTDAAQTALTRELTSRGLEYGPASEELETGFGPGIPGVFPSNAAVMEKALEPGGEIKDGMVELVTFFDGHELTRGCEALESAGIIPEIRPRAGNAMTGSPSWFEVWVAEAEVSGAQDLLREKLGLFPVGEVENDSLEDDEEDGTMSSVAVMETQGEAEDAVRRLRDKGLTARTIPVQDGEEGVGIEVKSSEQERALDILAAGLGLS